MVGPSYLASHTVVTGGESNVWSGVGLALVLLLLVALTARELMRAYGDDYFAARVHMLNVLIVPLSVGAAVVFVIRVATDILHL